MKNLCNLNPILTLNFLNKNYLQRLHEIYMKTDMNNSRSNEKVMNHILGFIEILLENIKQKIEESSDPNMIE